MARQDPKSQYATMIPIVIDKVMNNKNPEIFGNGEQSRVLLMLKMLLMAILLPWLRVKHAAIRLTLLEANLSALVCL